MGAYILAAVLLLFIIVVLWLYFAFFRKAGTMVREFVEAGGGMKKVTADIKDGMKSMTQSPKSVCGMTDVLRPVIKRDFPEFVWEQYREKVKTAVEKKIREELHGSEIRIHRTEISDYQNRCGMCTVEVQSSAGYRQENGDKVEKRFITPIIYVQDLLKVPQDQSGIYLKCSVCGAPVKTLGIKRCEYCGALIREINEKVWRVDVTREG